MFEFRPARLESTNVLVAFAGPSGCGKTYSALRTARGLVGDKGKVAFIDTEARRALHYANEFTFDHLEFGPPYRPERFIEAVKAAEAAKYGAIVIDSMSHEYDGIGGIKEWAEELEMGGMKSPGNWRDPKAAHRKLINELLQCRAHLIFCLRADEKIRIERKDGKTVIVPLGWVPICEKRFMFEMTASFTMLPENPGVPVPIKLQGQHAAGFPPGQQVSEASGQFLAGWANSGIKPAANENKSRTIPLVVFDDRFEVATAGDWLTQFSAAYARVQGKDAQTVWDTNSDIFHKILNTAKARNDNLMVERCDAIGRNVMARLSGG